MNATYMPNQETNLSAIIGKVLQLSTSASLGVLVTGMLLFFMCSLIAMDPPEIVETPTKVIEVVMSDEREIEAQPEEIQEKPPEPQSEPDIPDFTQSIDPVEGIKIAIAPTLDPGVVNVDGGYSSGSAMPIFRVAPQYPRRPQSRGIEGFVDLMFDISPTGKTENIRVVYAEPKGAFERASIKALSKWKYKPAMEDGVGQTQKDQTTRIKFELDQ